MLWGAVAAVVMEEKPSWRKQLLGWMLWVDCSLEGRVSGEGQHHGCRGWGQGPWGWTGRLEALVEGGEGAEQVSGLVNP